jgi:hypothetical protein
MCGGYIYSLYVDALVVLTLHANGVGNKPQSTLSIYIQTNISCVRISDKFISNSSKYKFTSLPQAYLSCGLQPRIIVKGMMTYLTVLNMVTTLRRALFFFDSITVIFAILSQQTGNISFLYYTSCFSMWINVIRLTFIIETELRYHYEYGGSNNNVWRI